jgi:protein-S-isoprenylcysteine O-methyltransferase Ste14
MPRLSSALLTALAVVFAVALTVASIELPQLANRALAGAFNTYEEPSRDPARLDIFPGLDSGQYPEVTDAFLERYHIRPIGYACLGLVVVLILVGFATERRAPAAAGAVALFLPVFGHFAFSMFFLAGLGLLRTVWMPVVDLSYQATGDLGHWPFRLGDVGHLPYMAVTWLTALVGVDSRHVVARLFMIVGIALFILGTVTWFRAKSAGERLAVAGVYRLSRHPQYLGWILWSYGLVAYLFQEGSTPNFKITWSLPDSLPWLVSALLIAGVAMVEEIRMGRELGAEYDEYRRRTPFLVPLPRWLQRLAALPMRLALGGREAPASGWQVLRVVAVYLVILMALSLAMIRLDIPPRGFLFAWPYTAWPFGGS